MPKITLGNVTVEGDGVTWQGAFDTWVMNQVLSLSGPDNDPPPTEQLKMILMARFRAMRKKLMAEYDWMFLEDSPATANAKQKAAAFRQVLRDIPQNYPDIRDAVFPDPDA